MPHELDTTASGKVRMAYNELSGVPWHRLGVPMRGLQTAEDMLRAATADYDVVLTKVAAVDDNGDMLRNPDGTPVIIANTHGTVRVNSDGTFDGMASVGTRFVVEQNKDCLLRALDVVGASKGEAVVDTCGVLRGGAEFFASLDLGALVIDPAGINDKIQRYLLVRNGHDGRTPITFANTPIRAVCRNTVVMGMKAATSTFKAKHTRNADQAMEQAQEILRFSTDWARTFAAEAERLLRVSVPSGGRQFDAIFNAAFPIEPNMSDRQKRNRDDVQMTMRSLYVNDKNAGGFGYNGWSAYNAFVEYFDHHRDADPRDRASASMDLTSWVSKKKQAVHSAILSFA
jgi:phage/plasmid-like protein (TIGR03299 family)